MEIVAPKLSSASISNRLGKIILSRQERIIRKRVTLKDDMTHDPLPNQITVRSSLIRQFLFDRKGDVLVSLEEPFISLEIMFFLEHTKLREDFDAFCKGMVFGSYLKEEVENERLEMRGFVIEEESQTSPYRFSEDEVRKLAGAGAETEMEFLCSPCGTIFVDKKSLVSLYSFPPLTYFLGYLKARSEVDKGLATHGFKSFYAALYELHAAQKLLEWADRSDEPHSIPAYLMVYSIWLHFAKNQLEGFKRNLTPEDRSLLEQCRVTREFL